MASLIGLVVDLTRSSRSQCGTKPIGEVPMRKHRRRSRNSTVRVEVVLAVVIQLLAAWLTSLILG